MNKVTKMELFQNLYETPGLADRLLAALRDGTLNGTDCFNCVYGIQSRLLNGDRLSERKTVRLAHFERARARFGPANPETYQTPLERFVFDIGEFDPYEGEVCSPESEKLQEAIVEWQKLSAKERK